jgi:acetate---CoA ligase (ADP-forming)
MSISTPMGRAITMSEDMTDSLENFLTPRSIALIGASDRSAYSRGAFTTAQTLGFTDRVHMVNRSGAPAHGRPAVRKCTQISGPVDTAVVMVPAEGVKDALTDAAAAGIRYAVILTSGYQEIGEHGAQAQKDLVAHARKLDLRIMGPNCLGFINYLDRIGACAMRPEVPPRPGGMAIVSQSGAIGSSIGRFAHQQGIGVSHLASTGNESDLDICSVAHCLLDDDRVRSMVLFVETIRHPQRFISMAERAQRLERPIVVLKIGSGALTAKVARAHTGALVGDDRVFEEVCRKYGLIRVDSMEAAVTTAGLAVHTGPIKTGGVGIVSISGGACEIIADVADKRGVPLADFTPETLARLREIMPAIGTAQNPLDVTGAVVRDPSLFERAIAVVARDAGVGLIGCVQALPSNETHQIGANRELLRAVATGLNAAPVPGALVNQVSTPVTEYGSRAMEESGLKHVTGGLNAFLEAAGCLIRWSRQLHRSAQQARSVAPRVPPLQGGRPLSEFDTLKYLGEAGVPVVPAKLATNEREAVEAARAFDSGAVVKIASPDIAHKSDVGGVLLNLHGEAAVAAAFRAVITNGRTKCPGAHIDGAIVAPMRTGGLELIVGVARDPVWGPVLAVGFGGIWVEALNDTQLRLLPVTHEEIVAALSQLRASRLLRGYRGTPEADLNAVASAVVRIGEAALVLGEGLTALEVNPLFVKGAQVEALDALVVWSGSDATPEAAGGGDSAAPVH